MGDRFDGMPDPITRGRQHGWGWRRRLKQDLLVFEGGGETGLAACLAGGAHLLGDIELTEKRVVTNVAVVHEPGHREPWIIALSEPPTVHRAFDHGLRWGIEAMFPDFKTRGFGLEDSHRERSDRMARLILVMALALFWAVSTGMWDAVHDATPDEKSTAPAAPKPPPQPDLVLQAWHPPPSGLPAAARPTAALVERVGELMGGKVLPLAAARTAPMIRRDPPDPMTLDRPWLLPFP
jgi:hypothetical protein